MTDKFVRKYLRFAQLVGSDQNPCLSRGIGSVIVDPDSNRILSTGYNGPAKGVPHLDSKESLAEFVYPQLTNEDKEVIANNSICKKIISNQECTKQSIKKIVGKPGYLSTEDDILTHDLYIAVDNPKYFADAFEGCKTCPRKLVGAKSGARLDLCSCVHSERNALLNAGCDLTGSYLFAYCGVPCVDCTIEIINAGVERVYCLQEDSGPADNVYASWRSEWQFSKAGVELHKVDKNWIHQND